MYLYQNNTTKCNISQLILIVFYLYFMYNLYGDNMNSNNNYVLWVFFVGYYILYLVFGGLISFLIGFSVLSITILIVIIRNKIREKIAFQKLNFI